MTWFKILCAVFILRSVESLSRIDPLVTTKLGLIRGLKATEGDYSMFLGIPYATVDKDNPFGASLPHPAFEGTFMATDDSARCPQLDDNNTLSGSLDCLHLNIFSPDSSNSHNLLPVLVWIHGGFFQRGSFSTEIFGAKFLVHHDIMLVTINYRLGPYGFMCLDTPEIPGNQGLKDQLMALKWIRDNIEAFGGDPTQVTLSGQSAGGAAVDFHLMYPGERLFNKVILQSGVAVTPARVIESDKTKPIKLAEHFGLMTSNLNEALSYLATIDTNSIVAAALELNIEFKACVEQQFQNVDRFIPEHPATAKRPHVKDIPVLIGSVNKEFLAAYFNRDSAYFENLNIFEEQLLTTFNFSDDLDAMHRIVRNFYVGDNVMTVNDKWSVIDFVSDFTYVYPIQRAMRKYLESDAKNIYSYVFSYAGGRNMVKYRNNILNAPGAAHADELGYLFDVSFLTEDVSVEDQAVIDTMTTMWTNFVKYGNPTPVTSELISSTWTPITAKTWNCLNIDEELRLEGRPFHDRMAFWDLFFRTNKKLEKGVKIKERLEEHLKIPIYY